MPAPRVFTKDQIDLARAMRVNQASWRAIGRALGCDENTIRCALDPDFLRKRHDGIVARRRERRLAAKQIREAKEARAVAATKGLYQPSRLAFIGRLTSLRGFA